MTYIQNRDFLIEVQKGNVAGHSLVHKFGRNDAVANGAWEHVSLLPQTTFLTAATTVRVKAGNAADTAAGAGAQSITIEGVDSNLVDASEAVETAGGSASGNTTASFWRVYRSYVTPLRAGAYGGNNTGDVIIENSAGTADLIKILAGEGQTQYGGYTIPTGKTGYLLGVLFTVDASKAADLRMYMRAAFNDFTTAFAPKLLKNYWDGIAGVFQFVPRSPITIAALTDVWFEAQGGGAITEVSVDFEILLVDD